MKHAMQLPEPGEMIGAKYRVEGLLGTGGMGAVYEVSHRVTGKRFAIKLLLPELTTFSDSVKRFIREAQVAGRFQHPNVVEIYDIGEYADTYFMVMELLRGESLASKLTREGRLSVEAACRILLPCLDGAGTAHAAGIVHRDIKPANIFLCEPRGSAESVPKLLDFGISKLIEAADLSNSATTDTGTVMGTPFYMAPEQLSSKPIDPRADVYALGVTLYQLLTGRHPFLASTYAELVIKIWSEVPTPVETLASDVPPELARVIARAMARNAGDRFESAEAMARALVPFAGGATFVPTAVSYVRAAPSETLAIVTEQLTTPLASESVRSRSRRGNSRARASVVILLGACAFAGYALWSGRRPATTPIPQPTAAAPVEPIPTQEPAPEPAGVPTPVEPEPEPPAEPEPPRAMKQPALRRAQAERRAVVTSESNDTTSRPPLRRPTPRIGSDQF